MFETPTDTLAFFFGLYLLAAGVGLLVDPKGYAGMLESFRETPALGYIAAIAAFVVGAFIVTVHNVWSGPVAILLTLVGWAAVAEGVLMLACRRWFLDLFAPLGSNVRFMRYFGIASAVLGALFLLSVLI